MNIIFGSENWWKKSSNNGKYICKVKVDQCLKYVQSFGARCPNYNEYSRYGNQHQFNRMLLMLIVILCRTLKAPNKSIPEKKLYAFLCFDSLLFYLMFCVKWRCFVREYVIIQWNVMMQKTNTQTRRARQQIRPIV